MVSNDMLPSIKEQDGKILGGGRGGDLGPRPPWGCSKITPINVFLCVALFFFVMTIMFKKWAIFLLY